MLLQPNVQGSQLNAGFKKGIGGKKKRNTYHSERFQNSFWL